MEWWMDEEYDKQHPMHYPSRDYGPTKVYPSNPVYDEKRKVWDGGPKIKVFVQRTWASS